MNFFKNLKIAYWATYRPDVFDAFVRLYIAKKEYHKKRRTHSKCQAEQRIYNIATARFYAALRG